VRYYGVPASLVTRFADVQAVYSDARLSVDPANAGDEAREVLWVVAWELIGLGKGIVFQDPPGHTRLRRLVSKAFSGRGVEALRPVLRQITRQLLDGIVPRGQADIIKDFSVPLAAQTIMTLIGMPLQDREQFQAMSNLFLSTDPADKAKVPRALEWMQNYIDGLVEAKRDTPADDLLSELIAVRDKDDRLDETELRSMVLLLLMAGFETTASFIGNGVLTLIQNPQQMRTLRAEPSLIPAAIEEMLRYCGPGKAALPRFATEDLTIGGVSIDRGDTVLASPAAANRDPRRFPAPDTFDVRRGETGHIAFAHGIHYCLGASLARMESEIAISALLHRCQDIEVAVPVNELSWRVTPLIRGLVQLPVKLSAL